MKIVLLTILILGIVAFTLVKSKGQIKSNSKDNHMNQISKDEFLELLTKSKINVELKLKNDICPLITNHKIYKNKSYILLSDIRSEIKASGNNFNIELESIEIIFDTKHPDKEATVIIKDNSNRYFTFYQVYYDGNPKVNHVANSIWEIVGSKTEFQENLNSDEKVVKIEFGTPITEILENENFIEFGIKYFDIKDYKSQMFKLTEQSNIDFELNQIEVISSDSMIVKLRVNINNVDEIIQLKNTKWYDPEFVSQMNQLLVKHKSGFRLSLLYHDKFEEDYRIKLSELTEYNELKKNNYLINHER